MWFVKVFNVNCSLTDSCLSFVSIRFPSALQWEGLVSVAGVPCFKCSCLCRAFIMGEQHFFFLQRTISMQRVTNWTIFYSQFGCFRTNVCSLRTVSGFFLSCGDKFVAYLACLLVKCLLMSFSLNTTILSGK